MKVTLFIFTYNQEKFITDCIDSALLQNYNFLEIFIWDNNSTDNTSSLIKKKIDNYTGNHKVIYHKSNINYFPGFYATNKLMEITDSDLIVLLAGDDYCVPNRVSTIVEKRIETRASVFSSSVYQIDINNKILSLINRLDTSHNFKQHSNIDDFLKIGGSAVCHGAGLAWHREIWDSFGPLNDGPLNIDIVLPFRGSAIGGNYYIEEPLVYWRLHEKNVDFQIRIDNAKSNLEKKILREKQLSNRLVNFLNIKKDMNLFFKNKKKTLYYFNLENLLNKRIFSIGRRWVDSKNDLLNNNII